MAGSHSSNEDIELRHFLRSPGCAMIFGVCFLLFGCIAFIEYSKGQDVLAVLDCGDNRQITFFQNRSSDQNGLYVYYDVRINHAIVTPKTGLFDSYDRNFEFDQIYAAGGQVVGVKLKNDTSDGYWVIHDFRDGASWPRGESDDQFRGNGKFSEKELAELLDREPKVTIGI